MNAQDQIKERAKEAVDNFSSWFNGYAEDGVEEAIRQWLVATLTAQQTADAAAHRELKREHNETLDVLLSLRNSCDDSLSQRDTARAESTKLREVLGKEIEALSHYRKGDDHAETEEFVAATAHFEEGDKLRTEALAATVLKEDSI